MSEPDIVTLADRSDTRNFTRGQPLVMTRGRLVPETWRHRLARRIGRLLWWRQPRSEVIAIDREAGTVTMTALRWSWRRWRWVRS